MVKAFTLLQMELKEKFRYKIEIFSASTDAILLIFPSIAILLFGNLEISGIQSKTEYIQYMLFSLILWQFVENMWSAVFEIRRKLKEGNFEYMMNMPLKGMHYVFGWAVSGVVSIVFEMIPLIVIFLLTSFHLLTVKSILSFLGIALMMAFWYIWICGNINGICDLFQRSRSIHLFNRKYCTFFRRSLFPCHPVTHSISCHFTSLSIYLGSRSCKKPLIWKLTDSSFAM